MSFQLKEYDRMIKIASEQIPELLQYNDGLVERSIRNYLKASFKGMYEPQPFLLDGVNENLAGYYTNLEFPILLNTMKYLETVKNLHYEILDKVEDEAMIVLKFNDDEKRDCISIRYDDFDWLDAILIDIDRNDKGRIKLNDIDGINESFKNNI